MSGIEASFHVNQFTWLRADGVLMRGTEPQEREGEWLMTVERVGDLNELAVAWADAEIAVAEAKTAVEDAQFQLERRQAELDDARHAFERAAAAKREERIVDTKPPRPAVEPTTER